jgi:hypothetical protein
MALTEIVSVASEFVNEIVADWLPRLSPRGSNSMESRVADNVTP